jgi:hypothetical protein
MPPLGSNPQQYMARVGATGETLSRSLVSGTLTLTTATLYGTAIVLPSGLPVNNATMTVTATAKSGGTHGWYCLCDYTQKVLAVSADQTDGATTWGTANAEQQLAMPGLTDAIWTPGLYILCVCVVATTPPSLAVGPTLDTGIAAAAPILTGNFGAGFSTPPALGSVIGSAFTAAGADNLYGWTS